jgi:PKD repeat protein
MPRVCEAERNPADIDRMKANSRSCLLALAAVLVWPAVALAQAEKPGASFSFAPEDPRAGDNVQFVSSSCQPGGRVVSQSWDLDGDGQYDDAQGSRASMTFAAPGQYSIGLQVTGRRGMTDVERRRVMVETIYVLPRPASSRLLSPFPVVTLGGRLTPSGARVTVLAVRAPVCSRVTVTCRGRGCPTRRASSYVGHRRLRLRRFERAYRAGAVITIRVSKGSSIGKFTQFRIRKHAAPRRDDLCLRPGQSKGSRCPRD